MNEYQPGDRVESLVMGYYMGLPGTIRGAAQIQSGYFKRYIIELDIGKVINLQTKHFKKIK